MNEVRLPRTPSAVRASARLAGRAMATESTAPESFSRVCRDHAGVREQHLIDRGHHAVAGSCCGRGPPGTCFPQPRAVRAHQKHRACAPALGLAGHSSVPGARAKGSVRAPARTQGAFESRHREPATVLCAHKFRPRSNPTRASRASGTPRITCNCSNRDQTSRKKKIEFVHNTEP